jgi:DNA-directed RNA polymerase specialized sigma24 family protein
MIASLDSPEEAVVQETTPIADAERTLEELAALVVQHSEPAARELYGRVVQGLRAFFAKRQASSEEVHRLAEETWVRLWCALEDGRFVPSGGAVLPYLHGIAVRVWSGHLRESSRRKNEVQAIASVPENARPAFAPSGEDPQATDWLEYETLLGALRDCIGERSHSTSLETSERQVVDGLRRGRLASQLAEQLATPRYQVTRLSQRAFKKLADCMDHKGFTQDHLGVIERIAGLPCHEERAWIPET